MEWNRLERNGTGSNQFVKVKKGKTCVFERFFFFRVRGQLTPTLQERTHARTLASYTVQS